ncbi:aldehyde dehydrogenase family protein [Pseudomonas sp. PDM24]|uniref:aldehyde dehydrogenase family protein n=1 Tax=Pseudomonas sp. PDM24 TaxID=2854777 RepID=UPI001C47C0AE|nr:aldehyde dehydrogenase family protein [Pseudomonas sp. PDM24]MBV7495071.1 aldehyde dehydrogenase family protein [Pseudomonas sp. PDM24]
MQSSLAELQRVFAMQKRHQAVVKASNADARINKLQRLKQAILRNQEEIVEALTTDLRRPRTSSPEFGAVIAEIDNAVIHLKKWMTPLEVNPSLPIPGASARIVREPRGVCALYGPWNFPILLVLQPLVAIVAAGNCAIVKPNELTPASSQVIARIIAESFDEAEVAVFEGGVELAEQMQELPFDHVFFTGSPAVGRTIMAAAARHLSSVTLELGGKCPVIIDHTVDLKDAAEKIIRGRCTNAGQLCLAPDHVWVRKDLRDELVQHLCETVRTLFYPQGFLDKNAFGCIVNGRNLQRLQGYLQDALQRGASLACGGEIEAADLTVHPTVLIDVPATATIMQEEIFGPLLPVMTWDSIDEAIRVINAHGKPLALYVFSNDDAFVDNVLLHTSSGGVTHNDVILHAVDPGLPFGGINGSGIGRYHGIHGFNELSNERPVFSVPDVAKRG